MKPNNKLAKIVKLFAALYLCMSIAGAGQDEWMWVECGQITGELSKVFSKNKATILTNQSGIYWGRAAANPTDTATNLGIVGTIDWDANFNIIYPVNGKVDNSAIGFTISKNPENKNGYMITFSNNVVFKLSQCQIKCSQIKPTTFVTEGIAPAQPGACAVS